MKRTLTAALTSLVVVLSSAAWSAPPAWAGGADKSAEAQSKSNSKSNGRHGPGIRSGLIRPTQHVYYPGDLISIHAVFPRSLKAYWNGEADAHLVVFTPDPDIPLISAPLDSDEPDKPRMLFEEVVDTSGLPDGAYQLGIVLTVPDGDPLVLADWYDGLRGLVSATRIRITSGPIAEDADGDGELDDDLDEDGFEDVSDDDVADDDDAADDDESDDDEDDEESEDDDSADDDSNAGLPTT